VPLDQEERVLVFGVSSVAARPEDSCLRLRFICAGIGKKARKLMKKRREAEK